MTKDGRPSRINDIRYFHGNGRAYLEGHEEAVAFGRRIAWFLNGEGYSLGAYPALYIHLTPSLEPGAIQVTDQGGDWWQRYTNVGVPPDFPNVPDATDLVKRGTVAALKTIRPDLAGMIDDANRIVRAHGDDLRFLLKTRQTKRFTIDIAFSIAVWAQPSLLFVSLTDLSTGVFLDAPPIPMLFYAEAFDLAGAVKIERATAVMSPNKSVGATLTSERHGGPLVKSLSDFTPRSRPVMSKLVKRRG